MKKISHEDIKDYVESQLACWPMAKGNYDNLAKCRRRLFSIGDLKGTLQYNPARIGSTGAKTDSASIANRTCFLCKKNRPLEQLSYEIEPGWEMLVNPFPIFPIHLTIVREDHVAQDHIPFEIISMAEKLDGMTIFFNGSRAGASAPDHQHLQGVLTEELPLMRLLAERHSASRSDCTFSEDLGLQLPYRVISSIIYPDEAGMKLAFQMMSEDNEGLVNFYCWLDRRGVLRMARVERKAHRPANYGIGVGKRLVSPGCIDMAGVIITPVPEDFDSITETEIEGILKECGQ